MIKILRADESSVNQHSICIALTANALSGAKEMYLSVGFDAYLSKPVDGLKLESILSQMLPAEKVLKEGDEGFVKHEPVQGEVNAANGVMAGNVGSAGLSPNDAAALSKLFEKKFDVNIVDGLRNCSGAEIYMDAARNFYDAIEEKSNDIEGFAAVEDWTNYTVLVHALKSSARLIGAGQLSALAASLEAAGDKAKTGAQEGIAEIKEKTPSLLEQYRAYRSKLAPLFEEFTFSSNAGSQNQVASNPQLPEMSLSEFKEAVSALKEVVSAFDFDSADMILSELSNYSIPAAYAPKFTEIKKAIKSVDQQQVMKLLDEIN